jgi:hypothetical protein
MEPPRIVLVPPGRGGTTATGFKCVAGGRSAAGDFCEVWATAPPVSKRATAPSNASSGIRFMVEHTLFKEKQTTN